MGSSWFSPLLVAVANWSLGVKCRRTYTQCGTCETALGDICGFGKSEERCQTTAMHISWGYRLVEDVAALVFEKVAAVCLMSVSD